MGILVFENYLRCPTHAFKGKLSPRHTELHKVSDWNKATGFVQIINKTLGRSLIISPLFWGFSTDKISTAGSLVQHYELFKCLLKVYTESLILNNTQNILSNLNIISTLVLGKFSDSL